MTNPHHTANTPVKSCAGQQVEHKADWREQLVNGGEIGPIQQVSTPVVMVTQIKGIFLDVDPKMFREEIDDRPVPKDPEQFFVEVIAPMLKRNSVLSKAEVRDSGSGLHVIVWFDEPVQIETAGDRERWAGIIRAVQCLLPSDPDAPGINGMTRPLGSVNGKNGRTVSQLKEGEPVAASEVRSVFEEIREAPVRTVAKVLFGRDRISPCPVCMAEGTELAALDRVAKCYGSCGKVRLDAFYNCFFEPQRPAQKGKTHDKR